MCLEYLILYPDSNEHTVEKCIIESHCFARIKRIIEERLQPSVPYNLGKDLEECKEVIKKLGYWT